MKIVKAVLIATAISLISQSAMAQEVIYVQQQPQVIYVQQPPQVVYVQQAPVYYQPNPYIVGAVIGAGTFGLIDILAHNHNHHRYYRR